MDSVRLKKGKEKAVRQLHPWVFSGAIDHVKGKPENGDIGKTGIHHFELSNGGKTFLQWTAGKDRSTASIWTR